MLSRCLPRIVIALSLAGIALGLWVHAPQSSIAGTVLERDREFDAGSNVAVAALNSVQIDNVATLGRVWGLLKYHHPKVTAGELHWDYELFRVLPVIVAATDRVAAQAALLAWIDRLGEIGAPERPAPLPADVHFTAGVAWLDDEGALGRALSRRLRMIHAARRPQTQQFYVSLAPGVDNPVFEHELDYRSFPPRDAGYALLALFRFWNIIQYWFPYRDLIGENWHEVLREFVPRFAAAADRDAYQRALISLIARVHDTHANLSTSYVMRPPRGEGQLPAWFRFVDHHAVVVRTLPPAEASARALQRGDVLLAIDGQPIDTLISMWRPYYAASNEPTRLRDMASTLGRGPEGPVMLSVRRDGATLVLPAVRMSASERQRTPSPRRELSGPAFRRLSERVAYLALSRAKAAEVPKYVEDAAGTHGWILDLRSYPADFPVLFRLGARLVDKPTQFVRFTMGDLSNPGLFFFGFDKPLLKPEAPRYRGKIIVLVDEVTVSRAEYFAMAFRAAPGAIVMGSTTAAADGNVSPIPLPGGLASRISGIGVFYPDKRPTQRVGIVPDIVVQPTIGGLRDGRDEVLEAAIREIVGRDVATEDVRKLIPVGQ